MASSPQPTAEAARTDLATAPAAPNLALVSLILGIASCIPALGVIFCIPAIVCGHLSLRRIQRHAGPPADRTRTLFGLTLGYVIAVIYAWMVIGLFIVPALSGR